MQGPSTEDLGQQHRARCPAAYVESAHTGFSRRPTDSAVSWRLPNSPHGASTAKRQELRTKSQFEVQQQTAHVRAVTGNELARRDMPRMKSSLWSTNHQEMWASRTPPPLSGVGSSSASKAELGNHSDLTGNSDWSVRPHTRSHSTQTPLSSGLCPVGEVHRCSVLPSITSNDHN